MTFKFAVIFFAGLLTLNVQDVFSQQVSTGHFTPMDSGRAVGGQLQTYCKPLNLDYGYSPIPNFSEQGRHRATADPVITLFKGNYYLFSTNQWGYWWSSDLLQWHFVFRKFLEPWRKVYDDLCAPATLVLGDTLLVLG